MSTSRWMAVASLLWVAAGTSAALPVLYLFVR